MFDAQGGFTVLGHRYRRITDLDENIGSGDLIRFVPPLDRDAEWYMFEYRAAHKVMVCVSWIGTKAGLENMSLLVQKDAFLSEKQQVPLQWFAQNWNSRFCASARFEDTQFFKFDRGN